MLKTKHLSWHISISKTFSPHITLILSLISLSAYSQIGHPQEDITKDFLNTQFKQCFNKNHIYVKASLNADEIQEFKKAIGNGRYQTKITDRSGNTFTDSLNLTNIELTEISASLTINVEKWLPYFCAKARIVPGD